MERSREVMTDLLERSAAVLRRYGGTVEYNGDEVMAIFGAPVTLEDHAFRACVAIRCGSPPAPSTPSATR
jgi:class 3 adenylate cyclase